MHKNIHVEGCGIATAVGPVGEEEVRAMDVFGTISPFPKRRTLGDPCGRHESVKVEGWKDAAWKPDGYDIYFFEQDVSGFLC